MRKLAPAACLLNRCDTSRDSRNIVLVSAQCVSISQCSRGKQGKTLKYNDNWLHVISGASLDRGLLLVVLPDVPTIGSTRMPSFDVTLNLPGFTIARTSGFNPIIHDLDCHEAPCCPHCGARDLRRKDKVQRQVWHESVGLCRVLLRFAVSKFPCRGCGRYFRQRFEGILAYQHSTEALKRQSIASTRRASRGAVWRRIAGAPTPRSRAITITCTSWRPASF